MDLKIINPDLNNKLLQRKGESSLPRIVYQHRLEHIQTLLPSDEHCICKVPRYLDGLLELFASLILRRKHHHRPE